MSDEDYGHARWGPERRWACDKVLKVRREGATYMVIFQTIMGEVCWTWHPSIDKDGNELDELGVWRDFTKGNG